MSNTEKNIHVKTQITTAFLDLLAQKEFKDISISEITSAAKVSRVSFYRNYEEKEDILRTYIKQLFSGWRKDENTIPEHSDSDNLRRLFGHLIEYKDFYLLLCKRNLLHLLKDILVEIYGPKPEESNFGAYTAAFLSYGLYGWIEEWFARGMEESAWEMTELLKIGI